MIEILTASVIWLFALTIYLFVRKLRKPKPVNEIKLQKIHLMRLGPFSGQSNSFKGKSVVFLMLLSSLYCLLYTSPSPRDATLSRMPSSA